jgi:hypothetical protein
MPSRRNRNQTNQADEATNVQEDTVSTDNLEYASAEPGAAETTDGPFAGDTSTLPEAVEPDADVDVETLPEADDEVEELPAGATNDASTEGKPKAAKKEKERARGDLPEDLVTPIGLTKAINERGLYTNREGEVAELKPQMVYSYIKNAPKERPYPGRTVTDSVGATRENVCTLEEGLAWWNAKNEAAAARRKNAAEKAKKAAEAKAKKAAGVTEAEGETTEAEQLADNAVLEEAE